MEELSDVCNGPACPPPGARDAKPVPGWFGVSPDTAEVPRMCASASALRTRVRKAVSSHSSPKLGLSASAVWD